MEQDSWEVGSGGFRRLVEEINIELEEEHLNHWGCGAVERTEEDIGVSEWVYTQGRRQSTVNSNMKHFDKHLFVS